MSTKTLRAFLDRFEADKAVLLVGDHRFSVDVPTTCLPDEATEGTLLKITIEIDTESTRDTAGRVDSQTRRLQDGE